MHGDRHTNNFLQEQEEQEDCRIDFLMIPTL